MKHLKNIINKKLIFFHYYEVALKNSNYNINKFLYTFDKIIFIDLLKICFFIDYKLLYIKKYNEKNKIKYSYIETFMNKCLTIINTIFYIYYLNLYRYGLEYIINYNKQEYKKLQYYNTYKTCINKFHYKYENALRYIWIKAVIYFGLNKYNKQYNKQYNFKYKPYK